MNAGCIAKVTKCDVDHVSHKTFDQEYRVATSYDGILLCLKKTGSNEQHSSCSSKTES
jgi:hypothetical protein